MRFGGPRREERRRCYGRPCPDRRQPEIPAQQAQVIRDANGLLSNLGNRRGPQTPCDDSRFRQTAGDARRRVGALLARDSHAIMPSITMLLITANASVEMELVTPNIARPSLYLFG